MAGFTTLPPWDASIYFFLPVQSVISIAAGTVPLVPANPNRVGLLIGCSAGPNATVGVNPAPAMGEGIPVNNLTPPLYITHEHWGSLVQAEWFLSAPIIGGVVTVIEVILRDWPNATN